MDTAVALDQLHLTLYWLS